SSPKNATTSLVLSMNARPQPRGRACHGRRIMASIRKNASLRCGAVGSSRPSARWLPLGLNAIDHVAGGQLSDGAYRSVTAGASPAECYYQQMLTIDLWPDARGHAVHRAPG